LHHRPSAYQADALLTELRPGRVIASESSAGDRNRTCDLRVTKARNRRDSNPQPPERQSGALAVAPRIPVHCCGPARLARRSNDAPTRESRSRVRTPFGRRPRAVAPAVASRTCIHRLSKSWDRCPKTPIAPPAMISAGGAIEPPHRESGVDAWPMAPGPPLPPASL
jgi:hypothetical protein